MRGIFGFLWRWTTARIIRGRVCVSAALVDRVTLSAALVGSASVSAALLGTVTLSAEIDECP